MRKFAAIFGASALCVAFAATEAKHNYFPGVTEDGGPAERPECRLNDINIEKTIKVSDSGVSYFASYEGTHVYYIGDGGNEMLDIQSGKSIAIPGDIDPVPTPDGLFTTVSGFIADKSGPQVIQRRSLQNALHTKFDERTQEAHTADEQEDVANRKNGALAFYRTGDFSKTGKDTKPFYTDPLMSDTYQSIGKFTQPYAGENNEIIPPIQQTVYRVMTSNAFRNYVVSPTNNLEASGTVSLFDSNDHFSLPMISKDGQYFSVYNESTQTTQIYRLDDSTKGYSLVLDLGYPTGKVDFSPDNSMITFHVDNYGMNQQFFSGVEADSSKDIVVMHLTSDFQKKINGIEGYTRLSAQPQLGAGTYFARFSTDGKKLMAIRDSGTDGHYSFVFFDAAKLPIAKFWTPKLGTPADDKSHAEYFLGDLWENYCHTEGNYRIPTVTQSALLIHNLDPENCQKLVTAQFQKYQKQVIEDLKRIQGLSEATLSALTLDDVLAACPKDDKVSRTLVMPHAVDLSGTAKPIQNANADLQQEFTQNCLRCHSGVEGHPRKFEVEALSKKDIENIFFKIRTTQMPADTHLSSDALLEFEMQLAYRSGVLDQKMATEPSPPVKANKP